MSFKVPSNPKHSMTLRLSTVVVSFPEFSFPCVPQSVAGLKELWEPFLNASLFTALASTAHLDPKEQFHSVLG